MQRIQDEEDRREPDDDFTERVKARAYEMREQADERGWRGEGEERDRRDGEEPAGRDDGDGWDGMWDPPTDGRYFLPEPRAGLRFQHQPFPPQALVDTRRKMHLFMKNFRMFARLLALRQMAKRQTVLGDLTLYDPVQVRAAIADLAKLWGVTKPVVTTTLGWLEQRGWVDSLRSAGGKRKRRAGVYVVGHVAQRWGTDRATGKRGPVGLRLLWRTGRWSDAELEKTRKKVKPALPSKVKETLPSPAEGKEKLTLRKHRKPLQAKVRVDV